MFERYMLALIVLSFAGGIIAWIFRAPRWPQQQHPTFFTDYKRIGDRRQ